MVGDNFIVFLGQFVIKLDCWRAYVPLTIQKISLLLDYWNVGLLQYLPIVLFRYTKQEK